MQMPPGMSGRSAYPAATAGSGEAGELQGEGGDQAGLGAAAQLMAAGPQPWPVPHHYQAGVFPQPTSHHPPYYPPYPPYYNSPYCYRGYTGAGAGESEPELAPPPPQPAIYPWMRESKSSRSAAFQQVDIRYKFV